MMADWSEVHFGEREWRIPAERTKMPHIVPLSARTMALLQDIQAMTGHGQYVFPSSRSEATLSNVALLASLRRMRYEQGTMMHGFRATASALWGGVLLI